MQQTVHRFIQQLLTFENQYLSLLAAASGSRYATLHVRSGSWPRTTDVPPRRRSTIVLTQARAQSQSTACVLHLGAVQYVSTLTFVLRALQVTSQAPLCTVQIAYSAAVRSSISVPLYVARKRRARVASKPAAATAPAPDRQIGTRTHRCRLRWQHGLGSVVSSSSRCESADNIVPSTPFPDDGVSFALSLQTSPACSQSL